jgi:hypothetical protein
MTGMMPPVATYQARGLVGTHRTRGAQTGLACGAAPGAGEEPSPTSRQEGGRHEAPGVDLVRRDDQRPLR